jgi:hypothetical protein
MNRELPNLTVSRTTKRNLKKTLKKNRPRGR